MFLHSEIWIVPLSAENTCRLFKWQTLEPGGGLEPIIAFWQFDVCVCVCVFGRGAVAAAGRYALRRAGASAGSLVKGRGGECNECNTAPRFTLVKSGG